MTCSMTCLRLGDIMQSLPPQKYFLYPPTVSARGSAPLETITFPSNGSTYLLIYRHGVGLTNYHRM